MYSQKESSIGLGRICKPPTNTVLHHMTRNATNRMIALVDGAIRQIRHTGLPDEAGSKFTVGCVLGLRAPQKCVAWTDADSRTLAKHTTARQLNQLVCRYRMFTALNATSDLDATTLPLGILRVRECDDSSIGRAASCYPRGDGSESGNGASALVVKSRLPDKSKTESRAVKWLFGPLILKSK